MNAFEEDIKNKELSTLISTYLRCQLCKMITKIPSICTKCGNDLFQLYKSIF